jgi:hypothetical protein
MRCGPPMGEVGAHQATGFLRCQGRDWRLLGWPLWQTVDAVQLLLVDIERAPVSKSVALDYRKEEARDLSPEQATLVGRRTPGDAWRLARAKRGRPSGRRHSAEEPDACLACGGTPSVATRRT